MGELMRFMKLPGHKILVRGNHGTRGYIGNTKAAMPKPLCFWAADGTEYMVSNDDVACFHYHTGCIFLAMQRDIFEQQLGEQTYTAVQLPWEGERFSQPYRIIEQQIERVKSENSLFPSDMILCWFQVGFSDPRLYPDEWTE